MFKSPSASGIKLVALLITLAPLVAAPETLCQSGETDFFSCMLREGQIVSVCGKIHDSPTSADWLQYRFGRPQMIEMAWPKDRQESLKKFEGNVFNRYSISDLRFLVGNALYGVSISAGGEDNGPGGKTRRSASLGVLRPGHPYVELACVRPNIDRYNGSFSTLNAVLFMRGVQTDMLQQYYQLAKPATSEK
ncbi:MAG: hypothetical protein ACJ8G1_28820 [Vitreoscilla sp.]